MNKQHRKISDEELEWLAEKYRAIKKNKTYRNLSKTFKDYINEFLDKELLELKKSKTVRYGMVKVL